MVFADRSICCFAVVVFVVVCTHVQQTVFFILDFSLLTTRLLEREREREGGKEIEKREREKSEREI